MLKLSVVLQDKTLGLTSLTLPSENEIEIAWAHVSELDDPTPWLAGGELLLTTGMGLFRDSESTHKYFERLAEAGVKSLGLSTGASLPHTEVPEILPAAAASAGIALVHVPENTPLVQVVRFVSDLMHNEQTEPLRRALLAQRQLSEAITEENGIAAVLTTLHLHTGIEAAVYDAGSRLLASTGTVAEARFDQRREEIAKRLISSRRWSMSEEDENCATLYFPLGSQGRGLGILVSVKPEKMNLYDRALISMVVSLVGVLLELFNSSSLQQRWLRGRALEELLEGNLDEVESSVRLAKVGIKCDKVQVAAIPSSAGTEQIDAIAAQLEPHSVTVAVSRRDEEWLLMVCDPTPEGSALLQELLELSKLRPAGIGMLVEPRNAKLSLTQAYRARALAERRGETVLALADITGYRAMLLLGDPEERGGFADAVLAPLDSYDQQHDSQLVRSLAAYLDNTSNIEAAALELGVHRHTMRARLRRISELTGRSFTESADVLELWLASELRAL